MRPTWALTLLAVPILVASSMGCASGHAGSPVPKGDVAVFLRDAAPVPIVDTTGQTVFTMTALRLTIEGAELRDTSGHGTAVTLHGNPVVVDVLSLSDTSVFFGWASVPAGTYEGLRLTVTAAEVLGSPVGSQTPQTVPLRVPAPEFEAEFQPPILLGPNQPSTVMIDWRPAVSAFRDPFSGGTTYTLEDDVHAFVLGAAGSPAASQPFHDLDGDVIALDCGAGTLTIEDAGIAFVVALDALTQYADDRGAPLANGCAGLAVGDEVEIEGTLTPNRTVASLVTIEDAGGALRGGSTDVEGFVRNRATTPAGSEFDVVSGTGAPLAHVVTDAATDFEFDRGGSTSAASVGEGALVEVEGTIDPPTGHLVADEVEIR